MQQTRDNVHRSKNMHPTPPQPIIVGIGQDAGNFPQMMVDVEVILSGSGLSNAHKKTIRGIADRRNPEEAIEAYLKKVERDATREGERGNPICLTDEMECDGTDGGAVMDHPANDANDKKYAKDNDRDLFGHVEMNRHRFMLGHPDGKDGKSNQPDYLPGVVGSDGSHDFNMEDGGAPIAQESVGAQGISIENMDTAELHEAQRRMDRPTLWTPEQEANTILHGSRDGDHQRPSRSELPSVWRAVPSASRRAERRRERSTASRNCERSPANPRLLDDRNTRKALRLSRYEKLGL
jgi:hypothetical protein